MKISDIYSAKGLKLKFTFEDSSVSFASGMLIRIDTSKRKGIFDFSICVRRGDRI